MSIELALNARFATRPLSGVDRVAAELTKAIVPLLAPSDGLRAFSPNSEIETVLPTPIKRGVLKGQFWEQVELPFSVGRRWLFSPCNTGPLAVSRQVLLIHDAQTFLEPLSYSPAFRAWYKFVLPRLARRARLVVTISEYSREQLERFGIVPVGKAKIVPNGADHILSIVPDETTLNRNGLTKGGYILAIGNLSPHKNLAMLMRAASMRPDGGPPLIIAGGGNSRVFAAAGLDPPPGVRMIGRVTDGELKALYNGALAFVFPSLTEGFGLPPLEAMLCGCPVIASNAGAIPEVCGDAARYVSPTDEQGWTAAMVEISASIECREALIANGHIRAAKFTWETSARTLLELISKENIRERDK